MLERLKSLGPLFIGCVVAPTFLAILYFGVLASDVYLSESRFIVRSPSQPTVSPISAVLSQTGIGSGPAEGNNAVIEYVQSRRALEEANADGYVLNAYTDSDIFFLDRFGAFFGRSQEELFGYYMGKVEVAEGISTGVMTIIVRGFDPQQAQEINKRLLDQSEDLVNGLSERAQADSIAIAEQEVEEAQASARAAAIELAEFRDQRGIVDPELESQVGLQMVSKLQDELIAARTQLRQLQTYTPQASQIPFLKTQIAALEREIAASEGGLTGGSGSLSKAMVRYQELRLASEYSEQQLAITLASLQEAQAEARRKRAYVERIAEPSLPDYAAEPRRIRNIFATLILGLLVWGVLSMLLVGIREHRD